MNGIVRFVSAGWADAERRIARLLPPSVVDDPWVTHVVASGVLARSLARVMRAGRAAMVSSRAAAIGRATTVSWGHAAWPARRRALGLCLLVAVATHVMLVGAVHFPVGWLWLILPGIVAMVGIILVLSAPTGVRR